MDAFNNLNENDSTTNNNLNKENLSKYGVWVKSGPENIDDKVINDDTSLEDNTLNNENSLDVPIDSIESSSQDLTDFGSNDTEKTSFNSSKTILSKIEEELLSIKNELSDLKNELASFKEPRPIEKNEVDKTNGFFDEDDDETIALTDDELDNILNTADITEEAPPETDLSDFVDTEIEPDQP